MRERMSTFAVTASRHTVALHPALRVPRVTLEATIQTSHNVCTILFMAFA